MSDIETDHKTNQDVDTLYRAFDRIHGVHPVGDQTREDPRDGWNEIRESGRSEPNW